MVTGKFQHAGVVNRNNRIYPRRCFEQQLQPNSDLMRRVRERKVIGHLEHPEDGRTDLSKAAVLITDLRMNETGEVMGTLETLSTPAGQVATALFKDKVTVGISSRGRGSVNTRDDGVDEVQEDYVMETFDLVADPSTFGAELVSESEKKGDKKLQLVLCESVKNPNAPELLEWRKNSLLEEAKRLEAAPVQAFRMVIDGAAGEVGAASAAISRSRLDYRILECNWAKKMSYVLYAADQKTLVEAFKKGAVQAMKDKEVSEHTANAIQSAIDGHVVTLVSMTVQRAPELDPITLVRESLKVVENQKPVVTVEPSAPPVLQERAAAVGTKNTTIRILFGSSSDREKFSRAWSNPRTLFQNNADPLQVLIIGHQEADTGRMEQSVIDLLQQLGIYESATVNDKPLGKSKPVTKLKEGYEIISTSRKTIAEVRYPDDATEADKADFVIALSKLSGIVGTLPRGDGKSLEVDLDGNRFDAAAAYELVNTAINDFNRPDMRLDARVEFTSRLVDLAVEFTGDAAESERTAFVNAVENTPDVDSIEVNDNTTILHFDGDVFSEEDAKKITLSLLTQAGVQYESRKASKKTKLSEGADGHTHEMGGPIDVEGGHIHRTGPAIGGSEGDVHYHETFTPIGDDAVHTHLTGPAIGNNPSGEHEHKTTEPKPFSLEGKDSHTHTALASYVAADAEPHQQDMKERAYPGNKDYKDTKFSVYFDDETQAQKFMANIKTVSPVSKVTWKDEDEINLEFTPGSAPSARRDAVLNTLQKIGAQVVERAYPDDVLSRIVTVYFDDLREVPKFKAAIEKQAVVTDVKPRDIDALEVWFASNTDADDRRVAIAVAADAANIRVDESARINHVDRGPTMQVEFERTSDASQFERLVKQLDVEAVHLTPRVMSVRFVDEITPQEAEAKIRGCLENCKLKSENVRVFPQMIFRGLLKEAGIQAHANQVITQRKVVAVANSRASASVAARRLNAVNLPNFIKRVSVPTEGGGPEIYFDIETSVSDKDAINLVNDVLARNELDETVSGVKMFIERKNRLQRSCNRLHEAEIETFVCATVEIELDEMPLETREHFNVFRSGECLDLITHHLETELNDAEIDYDDLYAGWEDDNPDTFFVKVYAPVETDVGSIVAVIKDVLELEEVEVEETDESTNTGTAVKALLVSEGKRVFMRFFDSKGARTVGPASLRATLRKFSENNKVPLWVSRTGDILVLSKVKEALEVLRKAANEISLKLEDAETAKAIELIAPGVLSGPKDPIAPTEAEADATEKPNTDDKPADDDYDVRVSEEDAVLVDPTKPEEDYDVKVSEAVELPDLSKWQKDKAVGFYAGMPDYTYYTPEGEYYIYPDRAVGGPGVSMQPYYFAQFTRKGADKAEPLGGGRDIAVALGNARRHYQKMMAEAVDPDVPTGVNVIPKDGKFIVYSDGMDKMLAGPFDTEQEAKDAMASILSSATKSEGGDYDVPVAGMQIGEASIVPYDTFKTWAKLKPYGFGESNTFIVVVALSHIGIVKKYSAEDLAAMTNPQYSPAKTVKNWQGAKPGWAALLYVTAHDMEPIAKSLPTKEAAVDALLRASYDGKGFIRPVQLTGFKASTSSESTLKEDARDHFALVNGTLYGDTGAIYAAEKMSDAIDHLGFGDFVARGVSLGSYGTVDVQFIRADGTTTGNKLMAAGFVGRPHALSFDGAKSGSEKDWAQAFAKMLRAAGVNEVSLDESGPKPTKPLRTEGAAVDAIRPGSRVTIRTPQGQERSGKAVMRSSYGGWVLNMGGAHGTPGLADDGNIVAVDGKRFTPTEEAVSDDSDIEQWKDDIRRGTLAPISTKSVIWMVKNRIIRRAPTGKGVSAALGRSPDAGKDASYEVKIVVPKDELPWVVPTVEPVQGGYGLYEPKGGAAVGYTILIIHHNSGSAAEGTLSRVNAALAKAAPKAQEIAQEAMGMSIADNRWILSPVVAETDSADVSAGSAEVAPIKKPDDEAGDGEKVKPNAKGPSPIVPVIGGGMGEATTEEDILGTMRAVILATNRNDPLWLWSDERGSNTLRALKALKSKGYVTVTQKDGKDFYKPTDAGKKYAGESVSEQALSFEDWMKAVDRAVDQRTGMSVYDLPDMPFRDWYDSGKSAVAAAAKAISNAKNYESRVTEAAAYSGAVSKAVLSMFNGFNLNPSVEQSSEDNGWIRFSMDAQEFPAELRNKALDIIYGKSFARDTVNPQAGNVQPHVLTLTVPQWVLMLKEYNVTQPVMTESASKILAAISELKQKPEGELRTARLAVMRKMREAKGAELEELKNQKVCIEAALNSKQFTTVMMQAESSVVASALHPDEIVVLVATKSLRPSARSEAATKSTGISGNQYREAQQALIGKGLLNSNTALNDYGRAVLAELEKRGTIPKSAKLEHLSSLRDGTSQLEPNGEKRAMLFWTARGESKPRFQAALNNSKDGKQTQWFNMANNGRGEAYVTLAADAELGRRQIEAFLRGVAPDAFVPHTQYSNVYVAKQLGESLLHEAETFDVARTRLLKELAEKGWVVQAGNPVQPLKFPHATKGDMRLYFKAQSIYFTFGPPFNMNDGHSLESDYRGMTIEKLLRAAEYFSGHKSVYEAMYGGHNIVFVVQGTDGKWFVATATNDDYTQGLAQYKGVLSKDAALKLGKEMAARWGTSLQVLKQSGMGTYVPTNEAVAADEDVAIEWDELSVDARNAALDAALIDNEYADSEWSDLPAKIQDKLYDFWKDYQTFESTRRVPRGSGKRKLREGLEDKPAVDQTTLAKQMKQAGYEIAGGGSETPTMYRNKKWYLYVWQPRTGKHAYYDFADDIFISDTDFAKLHVLPESVQPGVKVLKERLFLKPAGESLLRSIKRVLDDAGWDTSAFTADEVRRVGFVASVKEVPPEFTAGDLESLKSDEKAMREYKDKGFETPEAVMLAMNAKRQEKVDALRATFEKVRDAAKECNCADRAKLDTTTLPKNYVTLMVNFDTDMLVRAESCSHLHETLVQGSARLVTSGTGKSLQVEFDDAASADDFLNKAFERFPYDIYGRNDKNNASTVIRDSNPNGSSMNWIVTVNLKNTAGFEPEYETKAHEVANALLAMIGYRGGLKDKLTVAGVAEAKLLEGTKQTYHLFIRKPGATWWTWQLHLPQNDATMQREVERSKSRGYETAVRLVTIPDTGDLNAVMKAMGISGSGTIKNLPGSAVESVGKPNMSERPTGISMELTLDAMQEAEDTARVLNTLPGVRAEAKPLKEGAVVYATFQPEQYATITKAIFKAARNGMSKAVESLKTENDKLKIRNEALQQENTRVLEENRILGKLNEEMASIQHKAEMKAAQDSLFHRHPALRQFESEFDRCDTLDELSGLAERMLRISEKKGLDETAPVIQNKPRSEDALIERGTKSPSGIPNPAQLENTDAGLSFTEAKAKGTATVPDTFGRLAAHRNQGNRK